MSDKSKGEDRQCSFSLQGRALDFGYTAVADRAVFLIGGDVLLPGGSLRDGLAASSPPSPSATAGNIYSGLWYTVAGTTVGIVIPGFLMDRSVGMKPGGCPGYAARVSGPCKPSPLSNRLGQHCSRQGKPSWHHRAQPCRNIIVLRDHNITNHRGISSAIATGEGHTMVKTISSHMDHRIQQEYGNRLGPEQQTLIAELHALLAAVKGAELTNHLPARADRSVWECRHHIITFIMLYIVLSLKLAADKQRQA